MLTQILKIDENSLKLAENIILGGGVVAFPTETVYGLGASALDGAAVNSVFEIKGRPNDNPLIAHVHKDYDITRLVDGVPQYARLLAEAFLPGPLTMVFHSKGVVCKEVSCGLDTLAIRVPSHEGAQRLLKYLDIPIAAPSANISKHVSPVTSQHVYSDLNGKIPLILDGGKCSGGIESTVLDCTGEIPVVLRSGLVTQDMIAQVAGGCDVYVMKEGERVRSPGMKYKHYSPSCRTLMFDSGETGQAVKAYLQIENAGETPYILCENKVAKSIKVKNVLNLGETESEMAANLYQKLREGEQLADVIIAVAPEKRDGIMTGVMNRLTKACGKIIK